MYERALSPINMGGIEVKNRIARTAHATMMARGGRITDELIAYHAARAQGGVGLSILEAAGVHPSSLLSLANLDDSIVDGYRALTTAIAPTGMRLFQQLWHGGHIYPAPDGGPPLAPSDIPSHIAGIAPRPLTRRQIDEIIAGYAAAARRCEQGGLDGVEIHAGHGYLIAQFLSPVLNRREDEYGGDLEGRMHFLMRVLGAVRDAVSPGFVVGVRLSDSADPRILAMSDVAIVAARIEREGLIDYVNMSYGDYYALHRQVGGMDAPTGFQIPFTAPPVADSRLPRLLNGRFRTLEEVEQVLRAGEADLISMVRAHIADPDIVAKSAAGHPERVRPCIACNQGCIGRVATFGRLGCVVNTAAGDETRLAERLIAPAARPQRVLIVGGGPAGMEAARIAATAGHHVILAEAMPSLGGLTNVYRNAPRMGTIGDIAGWLEQEVYRLGVEVRLSSWLDADDIVAEGADTVILAIGADLDPVLRQVQFPADTVELEHGARIISSIELFSERGMDRGRSAVVVDELGHYEAIASAEHLLAQGVAVTFVTRHKMFAPGIDITLRTQSALERLHALGDFALRVGTQLIAARPGSVEVRPQFGGRVETVAADTVVWVPIRPGQPALAGELEARGVSALCIGDMLAGRNLQTAIREGHLAARGLQSSAIVRTPEPVDA
ncbi:MAG: FAD-dependent oxidoreductase [Sphingomonas sp.]|jgi:2,4-dienoyl-CoA reductase-like NADH-dependent reductase (Old Yellow Enzyme family)|uniref:oxidoreductase n=1 Tax=Sphingomonas sp. TaxID=28214 RepID=UPI0035676E53